jgi:cysteine-rich repeat protein
MTKQVLVGSDELWSMNVAYNIWFKVQQAGKTPGARAFSQLASLNDSGGYTNPTLLIGGANTSCELDDPPCAVWQPLNDVWLIDTAQAKTSESDKECQFDGLDDVITVHLPYWCSHVYSMGTLWLDMWSQPQMTGKKHKSILFDAYNGITPVLRWFLEFREDKLYAVLILNPGDGEVAVKRWGPIDRAIGFWRHYCFTLRFAHFYSSTDEWTPRPSIAQAFFFIDGEAVNEEISGSFLEIDLKQTLTMDQGLTAMFVGGPNPKAVEALGYRNFKGSADNIRVWWPACPHETDPSVCNPFAFLYPKLMDGRRQPSSGIQDSEVKMTHVARPVLDAMFSIKIADSETNGLIVAVGFDGTNLVDHVEKMRKTGQNTVDNVADETLFQVQAVTFEDFEDGDWVHAPRVLTCKGCSRQCTFETCQFFDIDCMKRGIEWNIHRIAQTGTCVCRDYKSCPSFCITPTSSVLFVNVTDGGRGYKFVRGDPVRVTFEGGGGSNASAEAFFANGTIISVKVLTSGTGYISPGPIVKFSGGGVSDCSICSNTSCCASAIVGLQLEGLQAKAAAPIGGEPSGGVDDTTGDEGGGGTTGEGVGSSGDGSSGGTSPPGDDSCVYSKDRMCDEPEWCDPGTDTTDCLSADVFNAVDTNDDQCISKDEFDANPRKPFCMDNITWEDSYGDGCDAYARNPEWCTFAESWADQNGKSALGRCCVCKNAREILFEDVTSRSIYFGCPGEISMADFDAFFWGACGDGIRGAGEECDDGNEDSGDGCSDTCTVESGYTCDTGTPRTPSICEQATSSGVCGDGTRDSGEYCDDGDVDPGDGCSDTCTVERGYTCDRGTPNLCEPDSRRVLLNRASPPPLPPLNRPAGGGSRNSPAGGGGGKGRGRNEKGMRPKRTKFTRGSSGGGGATTWTK